MNPQTTSLKLSAGSVSNILKFSHNSGTATKTSSSSSQAYSECQIMKRLFCHLCQSKQEAAGFKICAPEHAQKNETNLP